MAALLVPDRYSVFKLVRHPNQERWGANSWTYWKYNAWGFLNRVGTQIGPLYSPMLYSPIHWASAGLGISGPE